MPGFPVFVMTNDTRDLTRFDTLQALRRELEMIDVENEEYRAWDSNGAGLRLFPGQSGVEIADEPRPESRNELLQALQQVRERLANPPSNHPNANLVSVYEALATAYEQEHPRGRFSRRYPAWLPTQRGSD